MKQVKTNKNKNIKMVFLIPIIAVLGFVPVIVHMRQYDAGMEKFDWFPENSNIRVDMFMAYKSYAIMLFAAIMLIILIVRAVKGREEFRMETSYYLLLIYAIFVLMSGLFSVYKPQVFTGSYEIFQPMEVILGYLLICFYTYQYADTGERIKRVLLVSSIGFGIILVIGISQFIGYDFLQTTVGRMLISDAYHLDKLDTINFNTPKHTVYATLYNQDFLSFYFGLLTPVVMAAFVAVKKKLYKVILGITTIGCIACLIGSDASSGYLAFGIAIIAGIYVLLSRTRKTWSGGLIAAGAILIAGIIICVATPVGAHVERLFLGTQRSIDTRLIKSITTGDDDVVFDLGDKELHLTYEINAENGQLVVSFIDKDGNQLAADVVSSENGAAYQLQDTSYGNCTAEPVVMKDSLAIHVTMDNLEWYFSKLSDGTYYYYNPFGKWEKISEVKKSRLFRDDAMSGRGNIWDLTIPLLPKHILIGSGANTYGFELPQNDYVYKSYQNTTTVLVAKAHNWFLQEWVENGLIATLCLFTFYIWYLVRSIRIYHRCNLHDRYAILGFGIFVGTIGYVAAGIANDSNICTAPVFWVMMGLGMSLNRLIAEKENLFPIKEVGESEKTTIAPDTANMPAAPSSGSDKGKKKKSRKERKNGVK